MIRVELSVRDEVDIDKFFAQESVVQVVVFPSNGEFLSSYTQVLCNIGRAEHVLMFFAKNWVSVNFLGVVKPSYFEDVATCIEHAGGRVFHGRRRVYGRKKKTTSAKG